MNTHNSDNQGDVEALSPGFKCYAELEAEKGELPADPLAGGEWVKYKNKKKSCRKKKDKKTKHGKNPKLLSDSSL